MAAKLTKLTHKIAIQLHLVAESCTICSSRFRRPVRKLLDTLSYYKNNQTRCDNGVYRVTHNLSTRKLFSNPYKIGNKAVIAQSLWRWATGWMAGVLGFDSRRGLRIFLFTTASRTALGPTQSPIQGVAGLFPWGLSGRGVKLTTHLHLVTRSRMRGAIPPLP
jgi:hypothetical protein